MTIEEFKAKCFDELVNVVIEDKEKGWNDDEIKEDLSHALYYFTKAVEMMR